jgi:peroxiredoxin
MTFQKQLELCTFKSYYANSVQTLDYSKLFANRRTLVFSVPAPLPSINRLLKFCNNYQNLTDRGIDRIVCVSSDYPLIGPWADKQSDQIRGLADIDRKFVSALAEYYAVDKPLEHLARHWQYTVLINNGVPEKLWQNPVPVDTAWKIIKHPQFRYHGIGPGKVIEYLDSGKKDK